MSVPNCVNCKHSMKKFTNVNRMFLSKYVISDTTMYICQTCGEEYLPAKEYERIRKKVAAIESRITIPAVQEVIAKTKFLVL
ncbi:YgiT-type zinc finger protein [Candidatus Micrarchaeota archaeon]|nr:YgiT-type zinc finger protein [Candidatus Micrarchaeota archaeon]